MPVVTSTYEAPWFLRNGHAHTVYPAMRRRVPKVVYHRERLELEDEDFIDLDWSRCGGDKLVVVLHGLEGSSQGTYVKGMIRAFNRRGWDGVAMNFRGCSGEPNRLLRFYHSGVSDDLDRVMRVLVGRGYSQIGLVGFSLGGNVTLKYVGELGAAVPSVLSAAVAISVPCDLRASADVMAGPAHRPYMARFISDLHTKVKAKQSRWPQLLDDTGYDRIKTFRDFDDRYTAPIHGFRDAEDYWAKCSSCFLLPAIRLRSLLLNAADDPFLAGDCFPTRTAETHPHFHLEVPRHGGHVGFVGGGLEPDEYYSERRALEFLGAV